MRILKTSLIFVMPALLAGYVAWQLIPLQPKRSIPVPTGTKLLEFSPGGHYAVTFRPEDRRLTLWHTNTGKEAFSTEVPCIVKSDESTNRVRALYGFTSDDHMLTVATGKPERPHLVIINFESGNAEIPVTDLGGDLERYQPQPAFSSDGCYVTYFDGDCATIFEIANKRQKLRVEGVSSCIGAPTPQGKWLLQKGREIECLDIKQKQEEWTLPRWPVEHARIRSFISPDEQSATALAVVENRFPNQRVSHYRFDLRTKEMSQDWEYTVPSSARLLWNPISSDPVQFFLIKTFDSEGKLVEDLVDVESGKLLARYPHPIDMLEDIALNSEGQMAHNDAGLMLNLGRTGEMVIDSHQQVLASKLLIHESVWWRQFGGFLGKLGLKAPQPGLHLQFHAVSTGKLLERVPLHTPLGNPRNPFDPVIAMHPTEALVAIIDEQPDSTRLLFWQAPPPKPWGWIVLCSLAGGALGLLLRLAWRKWRLRQTPCLMPGTH